MTFLATIDSAGGPYWLWTLLRSWPRRLRLSIQALASFAPSSSESTRSTLSFHCPPGMSATNQPSLYLLMST
jgi:hypothetical protein